MDGTLTVLLVSLPPLKLNLRKSREAVGESGVEMVDLLGIEDKHKRAKAILRHLEENKKKTLKMKEAEEKRFRKKWRNSIILWIKLTRGEKR